MPATTANARYREVLRILVRRGFGFVVRPQFWPFSRGYEQTDEEARSRPAQVRAVLEELGTTFIKFGQILSTRHDLLPPEYIAELQKLQDAVPPVPTPFITERIEEDLRRPIGALFTAFDPVPLAAASIGQVHAVTLPGGVDAVVKVQRPGVREQVALDLRIATRLAALAEWRLSIRARTGIDLPALVDEFGWTLRNELDYLREAKNAEVFQRNFADNPAVRIPAICWEYTTASIITMERLRGLRIDDLPALAAAGYSTAALAEQSARIVLQEVFADGFFHADLHPGNLFVLEGGVIGAMDFGMVGTIDEGMRNNLLFLLLAAVQQDADQVTRSLYRLGIIGSGLIDPGLLRRDVRRLMAQYYGITLAELDVTQLLTDLLTLVRRYRLQLPPDLALLLKMLVMIEGLGRKLDPQFNILAVAQPYAREAIARLFSPPYLLAKVRQTALAYSQLAIDLPERAERILWQVEQGELLTKTAAVATNRVVNAMSVVFNRLIQAFGIVALLVMIVFLFVNDRRGGGDRFIRIALYVAIGTFLAAGAVYLISYWRSRRL